MYCVFLPLSSHFFPKILVCAPVCVCVCPCVYVYVCLDPTVTEQFKFNRISNLPLEIGAVFFLGKEEKNTALMKQEDSVSEKKMPQFTSFLICMSKMCPKKFVFINAA